MIKPLSSMLHNNKYKMATASGANLYFCPIYSRLINHINIILYYRTELSPFRTLHVEFLVFWPRFYEKIRLYYKSKCQNLYYWQLIFLCLFGHSFVMLICCNITKIFRISRIFRTRVSPLYACRCWGNACSRADFYRKQSDLDNQ